MLKVLKEVQTLQELIESLEEEKFQYETKINVINNKLKELYKKQVKSQLAGDRTLVDAGIVGED